MIIEELAYRIDAIKKITLPYSRVQTLKFNGEMGYLRNQSMEAILMYKVPPGSASSDTDWGVTATDSAYRIDPGEVIGPLFLDTFYFQVLAPGTDQLLVVIQGVR